MNQPKSGFEPEKGVAVDRTVIFVVVEATAKAEDAQKRSKKRSVAASVTASSTARECCWC